MGPKHENRTGFGGRRCTRTRRFGDSESSPRDEHPHLLRGRHVHRRDNRRRIRVRKTGSFAGVVGGIELAEAAGTVSRPAFDLEVPDQRRPHREIPPPDDPAGHVQGFVCPACGRGHGFAVGRRGGHPGGGASFRHPCFHVHPGHFQSGGTRGADIGGRGDGGPATRLDLPANGGGLRHSRRP